VCEGEVLAFDDQGARKVVAAMLATMRVMP
jgi:hypothetical protein